MGSLDLYSLNLAASCLSLFGSAAIIINYIFFINKKSQILYKLILFLSVADFGGSLSICISQILLFLHTYDGLAYGLDLCKVFRALINFFFVASFFWTAGIALHFSASARQKAQIPLKYFHIVCWSLPAIMTIILVSAGMIAKDGGPWCTNTTLGMHSFRLSHISSLLSFHVRKHKILKMEYLCLLLVGMIVKQGVLGILAHLIVYFLKRLCYFCLPVIVHPILLVLLISLFFLDKVNSRCLAFSCHILTRKQKLFVLPVSPIQKKKKRGKQER